MDKPISELLQELKLARILEQEAKANKESLLQMPGIKESIAEHKRATKEKERLEAEIRDQVLDLSEKGQGADFNGVKVKTRLKIGYDPEDALSWAKKNFTLSLTVDKKILDKYLKGLDIGKLPGFVKAKKEKYATIPTKIE